jgi:glycosyltransferase involved in cell wall biosynthesis
MDKLKILIFNDYAYIEGGTGKVAASSAIKLAQKGHEVIYFSAVGPVNKNLINSKIKEIICLDQRDILNNPSKFDAIISGIYNWRAVKRLQDLLAIWKPDIAHVHGISKALSWPIINILYKKKVPVIFTLHDYGLLCPNLGSYNFKTENFCSLYKPNMILKCLATNCDKRRYVHKLWRWLRYRISMDIFRINKKISGYIAVSNYMYYFFKDYIPSNKPFKIINNPINFEINIEDNCALIDNKAKFTFLYLGRLSLEKGIDILLDAIEKVDARLIIMGDGVMSHYCSDRAKVIGLDKILYLGWQDENRIAQEMQRCDAIVLPSRVKESAGIVIFEAAKYSLPAIVSNHGALIEFIKDGINGLYFESNNLNSLVDVMNKMINNEELTKELSKNSYEMFKKYGTDIDSHVSQLENFYNEFLKTK